MSKMEQKREWMGLYPEEMKAALAEMGEKPFRAAQVLRVAAREVQGERHVLSDDAGTGRELNLADVLLGVLAQRERQQAG